MSYNNEDEILSTDRYLTQNNFNDCIDSDELEIHITIYDAPQIEDRISPAYGPWSDNAHLVFDVPKLKTKEW